MQRWIAVVLVGVVSACGKANGEPEGRGSGIDPATCRAAATELGVYLMATPHAPPLRTPRWNFELEEKYDLAASPPGPGVTLAVRDRVLFLDGAEVALDDLSRKLRSLQERRPTRRMLVAIDRQTRWGRVVDVVERVRAAGFDELGFVFKVPAGPPSPPPRSAVDDRLEAILAGEHDKAVTIAGLAAEIAKPCAPLVKAFGMVERPEPERDLADVLIERTVSALIECNCAADIPQLRTIMWRMAYTPPDKGAVWLRGEPVGELALERYTEWSSASRSFTSGMQPVRFVVQPDW